MSRSSQVVKNINAVIDGKPEAIEAAVIVLLAEGHLLIEDVPGVGKTMLAKALGRSVDCEVRRIQFTPDLLPSDVTGVSVYHQGSAEFVFKPGAIFANIVIGDEINRASAKTQAALLEAMEERQVTVDGQSYELSRPFTVIATQNPFEMEGTYPLPESQRDRFMARIHMGYPDSQAEVAMISQRGSGDPYALLDPVVTRADVVSMIDEVRALHMSPELERYVVAIVQATRDNRDIQLGASPRAGLQLVHAAKARAYVRDREFVIPDDIDALATTVLAHRLVATRGADPSQAVQHIVESIPVPSGQN